MVICFLGDSIVQGIGDAELLGWAGRLARRSIAADPARATSFTFCNLGLRGDSSLRVAARWKDEALRRQRPGEEIAFVFSFGAADRPQKVARKEALSAAKAMLKEAKGLGRTLFVATPPASDAAWAAANRGLGQGLLEACVKLGVPGLDPFPLLAASEVYMTSLARVDGIHPDAAGYEAFADIVGSWEPMRELLGL